MWFTFVIHYGLHFLFPGLLAWLLFRSRWKVAWIIMLATMIVDIDHLFSDPIFDTHRCSIGFHPLHSGYAMLLYAVLLFVPNVYVRMIAVGLLFHMFTDGMDCLLMLIR